HRGAGSRRKQHALCTVRQLFREPECVLSSKPALDSPTEACLADMHAFDVHRAVKTANQSVQKDRATVNDNHIEIGGVDLGIFSARDLKKDPLKATRPRQQAIRKTELLEALPRSAEKDRVYTRAGQNPFIDSELQCRKMAVPD